MLPVLIQQSSSAAARLARSAQPTAPVVRHRRTDRRAPVAG
jgi:hypothetical protein